MSSTATVRIMSAEEIAARSGGQTPFLALPQVASMFAEREMRLRQLAAGHAMSDFLLFAAELAHVQHDCLQGYAGVPLPSADEVARASKMGVPLLPAGDWPRAGIWRDELRPMLRALRERVPPSTHAVLERVCDASDDWLEQQADCLLTNVTHGLDMGAAPLIAAGLQVYWTHMVAATQAVYASDAGPFGRIDDVSVCPCCGSRPTASIVRLSGELAGQRYLHCSLCSAQWHLERIKCAACLSTKHIAYQSLQPAHHEGDDAAPAAVQAEACDDCGSYLKIMHTERDALVEAIADDLATVMLDLLVSESGKVRHGVNFMLLYGEPEPPPDTGLQ